MFTEKTSCFCSVLSETQEYSNLGDARVPRTTDSEILRFAIISEKHEKLSHFPKKQESYTE